MSVSDQTRNSQIIQYLCSQDPRAIVVDCCCEFPATSNNLQNTGTGAVAGSLFTGLAALFPTVWTDVNVLIELLNRGAKQGRFKRFVDTAGDEYWYIDLFMIKKNCANRVYLGDCDAIKDCPRVSSTYPSI